MTRVEQEIRNRIRVAVAAYAYEILDDQIIPDGEFDRLSLEIDLSVDTGNTKMDRFFRKHFLDFTGSWVHKHPDKKGLQRIYEILKKSQGAVK